MNNDIKKDLTGHPALRERKNKNRYIAIKLERKYHTGLSTEALVNIIIDSSSMDRAWRKVLQDNPELRGTDYGDKDELEEKKVLELGYNLPTP